MPTISPFSGPAPKTLLGRHRVLSPLASIRVSPLLLGTTNFGTKWTAYMGECSKETAFEILDLYYTSGGNFIDTSGYYQEGETELWLGEWLAARGNRDEIVLATKYSANDVLPHAEENTILSNYGGNNSKALKLTVDKSLKTLGTTYLDILYVHWWDFVTSPSELMRALNRLVEAGTVLYLGASNMPAWFVVKCNAYARQYNLAPFVIYTGRWNAAERDMEREILAMCESEQMAVAPFEALGGGRFKTPEQIKEQKDRRMEFYPDSVLKYNKVGAALAKIAERKSTLPTSIALAYVMQKQAYVFPLIGGRKVDYLKANIEALSISLDDGDIKAIEAATDWTPGYPFDVLTMGSGSFDGPEDLALLTGTYDYVQSPAAIRPAKGQ
ncbi:Norsolorinic acid reductase A [Lachnellula occidentalis]|uniref:Norsolorinic acid reductase A n=1 Tax=Lachnellula occidentalis TaxID=215460 RepID=A0A8H8RD91_9HELO|nr:Norsolorinic acid reductase A [Lachnellula occidentalis]